MCLYNPYDGKDCNCGEFAVLESRCSVINASSFEFRGEGNRLSDPVIGVQLRELSERAGPALAEAGPLTARLVG